MSTIVLRSTKGSPLTNDEVDANFTNLNTDKTQFSNSAGLAGYVSDATGSGKLVFGTSPTISTSMATDTISFALLNTVAQTINAFGAATAINIGAATGTTTVNNNLNCKGDVQAYSSSDIRFKVNIQPIADALNKVNGISGVTFEWTDEYKHRFSHEAEAVQLPSQVGVIAQELQVVFPELVVEREDGYLAVDYPKITALLIEAIKELSDKVDKLQQLNGII